MRATLDTVIVQQTPAPDFAGLIALAAQPQPNSGTVIAVGPGKKYRDVIVPTGVKVGDVVEFPPLTGQVLDHDGQRYLVMRAADIVFIH